MTSLTALDLANNAIQGQLNPCLSRLTELSVLSLPGNSLEGDLDHDVEGAGLADMPWLQSLSLSKNEFSGPWPRELGRMEMLQDLHLSMNKLTGAVPSNLSMPSLRVLRLSFNKFTGSLDFLGGLTSLSELQLQHNKFSGAIPTSLSTLRDLRMVQLQHNLLTDVSQVDWNECTHKLQHLDLSHNKVSPARTSQYMQHAGVAL